MLSIQLHIGLIHNEFNYKAVLFIINLDNKTKRSIQPICLPTRRC